MLIDYKSSSRGHICKDCFNAYHRYWEQTNPKKKERMEQHNNYARNNLLGMICSDGKSRYVKVQNKRPYTGFCELCLKSKDNFKKLVYHHWNDEDFSKGLWLCQKCHNIAENTENELSRKYLELKNKIDGIITK
jgi:hypothetical protein